MTKIFIQDLNFKKDIGANSCLLEVGVFRFIIDAGMDPKCLGNAALPNFELIEPKSIDFIILTHCHLDHLGSLPILAKKQSNAQVLVSLPTSLLAPQMLENSYSVMCRQKLEKDIAEYPLFNKEEIAALSKRFFVLKTGKPYCIEKEGHQAKITFFSAGHVLGASSILIECEGRQIFITGDILFSDQHSLQGARVPLLTSTDVLLLETTRGATERKQTRRAEEIRLIKTIQKTIKRGGTCLIPAFALGRMQELLVLFYKTKLENKFPNCPIFCSGLGMSLIETFDAMGKKLPAVNFSRQIVRKLNIKSLRRKKIDPRTTQLKSPAIYLLSSGMLVEHTPAYQVAACLLQDNKNTICFVGYCDERTPGGRLLQTKTNEKFTFDEFKYTVPLRAQIERFDLSGHADREELCQFILEQKPKTVVLTHGDENARQWFFSNIQSHTKEISVLDPNVGQKYEL